MKTNFYMHYLLDYFYKLSVRSKKVSKKSKTKEQHIKNDKIRHKEGQYRI